jgi:cytochrome c553
MVNNARSVLLIAAVAAAAAAAGAGSAAPALAATANGTTATGSTKVVVAPEPFRYCAVCHGVELIGNRAVDAPRLAGLPEWYLTNQMQAFRNGWRGAHPEDINGMEMRPQATVLTPGQVAQAVAYAASVPLAPPVAPTVDGDTRRGEALYETCAACHGARGEGSQALSAPPLTGQSDWYLATQLALFRSGARGTAPGDVQGAVMRASALVLPDDEAIADVVAYVNTLQETH